MVSHMKTTLNIDDTVMTRLRREANRQGRTMSELVEMALRLLFQSAGPKSKTKLPPLPRMHSGGHLVDIADRNALYQAMEGSLLPRFGSGILRRSSRESAEKAKSTLRGGGMPDCIQPSD